jgi:hypothetical protein
MAMTLICDGPLCGKVFEYREGPAHFARRPRHFCSLTCRATLHGQDGTKRHEIWERSKRRALKNGVPFTLRLEDVPIIPERCPILGILIVELGYVPSNVRIISNRANRLRGDATSAELFLLARDARRIGQ